MYLTILAQNRLSGSVCLDGAECLKVYGNFSITSWSSSVGGGTNCFVALLVVVLVGSTSVLVGSAFNHSDVAGEVCAATPIYRVY